MDRKCFYFCNMALPSSLLTEKIYHKCHTDSRKMFTFCKLYEKIYKQV